MRVSARKEKTRKQLRLPYSPLPRKAKGIGISSFSRGDSKVDSNWRRIRQDVFERYGTACYYCGAPPGKRSHDCHEVFTIDDVARILRLVDIVPACHQCHEWADGKVFLMPQYFRTRTELKSLLQSWLGEDIDDPDHILSSADEHAYEVIQHFRRVNRITIADARRYVEEAMRQHDSRARVSKWRVDYDKWHWALGLLFGEMLIFK